MIMGVEMSALLCVFLLYWTLPSLRAERHSLYYIYTGLSKPVDLPGIYEFSAMGLLDDIQIDYYDSKLKRKIPRQPWMKEKMHDDYWEKGTQSRMSEEQWLNKSLKHLINHMRHNESDLHVLQWRVGCEIEILGSKPNFSSGVSEYAYDGENFLSFDIKKAQWVPSVEAAQLTNSIWDNMKPNTKDYLENECVKWLNRFIKDLDKELRHDSAPDVHVFAKRSTCDKSKLNLTCLATGFYPKHVMLIIRKNQTSLPDDEIESTEIRPNHDGTFQLRKSVEIKEDEPAEYYCHVTHRTLKTPAIDKWDGKCSDHSSAVVCWIKVIGYCFAVVAVLLICFCLVYFLVTKYIVFSPIKTPKPDEDKNAGVPLARTPETD